VIRSTPTESCYPTRLPGTVWHRARGLFAGIWLEGSTIRPDNDANKRIYGERISPKDIVIAHETHVPPTAEGLISTLNRKTPKDKSS
jgi:lipid-binding SYLF domain-containing protein